MCICVLCLMPAIHEEQTRGTEEEAKTAKDDAQYPGIRTIQKTAGNASLSVNVK